MIKQEFRFTLKVFLRLLIFIGIAYLLITLLSSKSKKEEVSPTLGDITTLIEEETDDGFINDLYQKLPDQSRQQLENVKDTQTSVFIQKKIDLAKEQVVNFSDEQIKEIKKAVVQEKCEEIIRNIDEN
jgi:hypothetical protein